MEIRRILAGVAVALLVSTKAGADAPPTDPAKVEDRVVCVAAEAVKPDMKIVTPEWRALLKTDKQCPAGEVLVLLPDESGPSMAPIKIDPYP